VKQKTQKPLTKHSKNLFGNRNIVYNLRRQDILFFFNSKKKTWFDKEKEKNTDLLFIVLFHTLYIGCVPQKDER
jgi:hypothetical protein